MNPDNPNAVELEETLDPLSASKPRVETKKGITLEPNLLKYSQTIKRFRAHSPRTRKR